MVKELRIEKSILINAEQTKVWESLTNPEITKKYFFGCEVISDWKIGNPVKFKAENDGKEIIYVKGKILNIEANKLLQFTAWGPESGLEDIGTNYTIVTYILSTKNGKTKFSITQENFGDDEKRYKDSERGWNHLLTALKEFLENPINQ